jgi:hypothetical protein
MLSDDYWNSVVLQAKDKKEGLDGIQIWNLAMQAFGDFDQCTHFVKELATAELKSELVV